MFMFFIIFNTGVLNEFLPSKYVQPKNKQKKVEENNDTQNANRQQNMTLNNVYN